MIQRKMTTHKYLGATFGMMNFLWKRIFFNHRKGWTKGHKQQKNINSIF